MRGWLLSIAIHGLLLLGTLGVVRSWTESVRQADLSCSIRSPAPILDHIDQIEDVLAWNGGDVEATLPKPEEHGDWYGPLPNPGWFVLIAEECECGTCVRQIFREYQGRLVVVRRWEYRLLMHPERTFAASRESLANNRAGAPRLRP